MANEDRYTLTARVDTDMKLGAIPNPNPGNSAAFQNTPRGTTYTQCKIGRYREKHFQVELGWNAGARWLYIPHWNGFGSSAHDVLLHMAGQKDLSGRNGLGHWKEAKAFSGPLGWLVGLQPWVEFLRTTRQGGYGTTQNEGTAKFDFLEIPISDSFDRYVDAEASLIAYTSHSGGGLAIALNLNFEINLNQIIKEMLSMSDGKKVNEAIKKKYQQFKKDFPRLAEAFEAVSNFFNFKVGGSFALQIGMAHLDQPGGGVELRPYVRISTRGSANFWIKTGVKAIDNVLKGVKMQAGFNRSWQIDLTNARGHFAHFLEMA